jgi:hypothetical protein
MPVENMEEEGLAKAGSLIDSQSFTVIVPPGAFHSQPIAVIFKQKNPSGTK